MTLSTVHCAAVILAAGYSSRLGRFKPLLQVDGQALIRRAVSLFRRVGVGEIIVVTGHRAGEVGSALEGEVVRTVFNRDYPEGMYSSVASGAEAVPDGCDAFFILPVDVPLVRPATPAALLRAWTQKPNRIFYPRFDGTRGHPPLLPVGLKNEIVAGRPAGGLQKLLEKWEDAADDVDVADRHILFDIDTPADEAEVLARWRRYGIPTEQEVRTILDVLHPISAEVRAHSRAVARVADLLSRALSDAGLSLDAELIRAAALLHDIAKGCHDHAEIGAKWLQELGFDRAAEIVAAHTGEGIIPGSRPDERAVVYLADKYIHGRRLVPLENRFRRALKRFGDDAGAAAAIHRRRRQAEQVRADVQQRLGRPLEKVFAARDPQSV